MEIFYEWFIEILIIEMKWKHIFSIFELSSYAKWWGFYSWLFFWNYDTNAYNVLVKLNGKSFLVEENHDTHFLDYKDFNDYVFIDIWDYMELNFDKKL